MAARTLDPETVELLRRSALTYGASNSGKLTESDGYQRVSKARLLGDDARVFEDASERLFSWQMHNDAGFRVRASSPRVTQDAVLVLRTWIGPVRVKAPCRVVAVIHTEHQCGFTYGTLPGHPVSGEEEFLIERDEDGHVTATVTAWSKPAWLLTRVGSPVTRKFQERAANRYLAALSA